MILKKWVSLTTCLAPMEGSYLEEGVNGTEIIYARYPDHAVGMGAAQMEVQDGTISTFKLL